MQNDLSQKIDNLQYSISRLTNLNTVQEKGIFPSQPHQNPKGIHEVETHEGESSQAWKKISVITDISVLRFYGYIGYIGAISADILEKNIGRLKIVKNSWKCKKNLIII